MASRRLRGYLGAGAAAWAAVWLAACGGSGGAGAGSHSALITIANYTNFAADVTIGSETQRIGAESQGSYTARWTGGDSTTVSLRAVAVGRAELTRAWSATVTDGATARTFVEFDSPARDRIGGVPCDYLARRTWDSFWKDVDPIRVLRAKGFGWVRVGVTTVSSGDLKATDPARWSSLPWKNEYWSSLEYAAEILHEAAGAGLRLQVFLFLSDTAAHAGIQDPPAAWRDKDVAETAQALEAYAYTTAKDLADRGLRVEAYDIGNEIEAGIVGFRPDQRIPRPAGVDVTRDMGYMRTQVWTIEADLLKAAIRGVRRANPSAAIVLHADSVGWNNDNTRTRTFFETMVEYGVDFEVAGLSYPYSMYADNDGIPKPYFASPAFTELIGDLAALGKRVQISEYMYPNDPTGTSGQPDAGYPFSPEGQAAWIRNFLAAVAGRPEVERAFYFYPEYFRGMSHGDVPGIESSGLFRSDGEVQPGLRVFFP
ncbi:MAG TPA: glycosyl hydrolase 53 family protein [Vicinamibacteria bacterium]|nr:glycosyl hydrolase 53 family protein [Vicinamibacteria bacterium]